MIGKARCYLAPANMAFTSAIELKENTVIIVLGASGDLAKKKTFPALFGLVASPPLCR